MSKNMKKTMMAMVMTVIMILSTTTVYANVSTINEAMSIKIQADSLIASIDESSLMLDAVENVVDYSVPLSIRESIVTSAKFTPLAGVDKDEIELEVNSTVQKIGEIVNKNGNISNMYVAVVAASETKEDWDYTKKHGIEAWAYVYWIDNLGTNNQLSAAGAKWKPKDKIVNNRQVKYGTSDPTGLFWLSGPTVKYTTENDYYIEDSSYSGLTLRCETKIDVVNMGTVTCNVTSGFLS